MTKIEIKKVFLTWECIQKLIDIICNDIRTNHPDITSVHGLSRGGLIPAVLISHQLNIPYVNSITLNTLIVDDICDSGETLEKYQIFKTATLYHKLTASCTPTIYAEITEDVWINFPWESVDSKSIQDYKIK